MVSLGLGLGSNVRILDAIVMISAQGLMQRSTTSSSSEGTECILSRDEDH